MGWWYRFKTQPSEAFDIFSDVHIPMVTDLARGVNLLKMEFGKHPQFMLESVLGLWAFLGGSGVIGMVGVIHSLI